MKTQAAVSWKMKFFIGFEVMADTYFLKMRLRKLFGVDKL